MDLALSVFIIAVGIGVFFIMKKFSHTSKTYIVNFALALLLGLIVVRTFMLEPIDWIGYLAIVFCGLGFLAQLVLGFKNLKTSDQ